jgi:hypothetical protein
VIKRFIAAQQPSLYNLLPVVAALFMVAHSQAIYIRTNAVYDYFILMTQYFFAGFPLLLAHHFALGQRFKIGFAIWAVGFLLYPLLFNFLIGRLGGVEPWFTNSFLGAAAASVLWVINQRLAEVKVAPSVRFNNRLLSVNGVVILLALFWVLVITAVFSSHPNPLLNQPIPLTIYPIQVLSQPLTLLNYGWQFALMASLVLTFYFTNRYLLIRLVFNHYGVLAYLSAGVIVILLYTPLLSIIALWLPINRVEGAENNLLPGGNANPFDAFNYQFSCIFLIATTPIIFAAEMRLNRAKVLEIEKQKVSTELKLLQQQINPHFLFNTLNNLYALTLEKSDSAPDLVMQLSNLLRYSVYEGEKNNVVLSKEIDYLKDYIALQQIRHANKCTVNVSWPDASEQLFITPLMLIVLLENAFKYGVEPAVDPVSLDIDCSIKNNTLTVIIENPIIRADSVHPGGLGLKNLQRRLELLYPNRYELQSQRLGSRWRCKLSLELASC